MKILHLNFLLCFCVFYFTCLLWRWLRFLKLQLFSNYCSEISSFYFYSYSCNSYILICIIFTMEIKFNNISCFPLHNTRILGWVNSIYYSFMYSMLYVVILVLKPQINTFVSILLFLFIYKSFFTHHSFVQLFVSSEFIFFSKDMD